MLKYIKICAVFLVIVFLLPCVCIASNTIYTWSNSAKSLSETVQANSAIASSLNLNVGGAVLIEQRSGQVLYEQNMHEKLRPASVTKVMTILLIMEAIDSGRLSYSDKIPCSEKAAGMGGSQIWLDVREELTVDEMLKAKKELADLAVYEGEKIITELSDEEIYQIFTLSA